ncbi:MAG: thiosulfate sulfurtransferase GlpE [Litorivicinus sp.]
MFKHLSVQQMATLDAQVLDIRDAQSYSAGHIPGAQAVTQENSAQLLTQLDKTKPVVVCCYHGNSSQSAAAYLAEQGFSEVYSLDGGFEQWRMQHPDQISTGES